MPMNPEDLIRAPSQAALQMSVVNGCGTNPTTKTIASPRGCRHAGRSGRKGGGGIGSVEAVRTEG